MDNTRTFQQVWTLLAQKLAAAQEIRKFLYQNAINRLLKDLKAESSE